MRYNYLGFQTVLLVFFLILQVACKKDNTATVSYTPPKDSTDNPPKDTGDINSADTFVVYRILKGKNYCEGNHYPIYQSKILKFQAILDSSCMYKNLLPENQNDINKLYGFSDCTSLHHANSARFGWNWKDGALRIHAYCYVDSVRQYKELGQVKIGEMFECSLEVLPQQYKFTLNGESHIMPRYCDDSIANGIKLLPYFGGDEPAPQDIIVRIKEME